MKTKAFTFFLIMVLGFTGIAQTTRFFEFATVCGSGNWQDTSFIASTSDQTLIDAVLAELPKPFDQRNFINGPIDYGHGGHNHNASHWFQWHFIPDQWELTEFAVEVCDGCPYTDVDLDTAYWVGILGRFCPWSGKPVREVASPVLSIKTPSRIDEMTLFPNPAKDRVYLNKNHPGPVSVTIHNSLGQVLATRHLIHQNESFDLSNLIPGLYFVQIHHGDQSGVKTLVVMND